MYEHTTLTNKGSNTMTKLNSLCQLPSSADERLPTSSSIIDEVESFNLIHDSTISPAYVLFLHLLKKMCLFNMISIESASFDVKADSTIVDDILRVSVQNIKGNIEIKFYLPLYESRPQERLFELMRLVISSKSFEIVSLDVSYETVEYYNISVETQSALVKRAIEVLTGRCDTHLWLDTREEASYYVDRLHSGNHITDCKEILNKLIESLKIHPAQTKRAMISTYCYFKLSGDVFEKLNLDDYESYKSTTHTTDVTQLHHFKESPSTTPALIYTEELDHNDDPKKSTIAVFVDESLLMYR